MDLQAPLGEPAQLLRQQGRPGVDQQTAAKLGFGGVHRHVEGGEALAFDALPIGGGEVGEREVAAVEEAEAVVVVLEIEAAAVAGGLLVDETEGAAVVALAQSVEQGFAEGQAQALVSILLQLHHVAAAVGILHLEHQLLLRAEHLQIDQIARSDAVDAQQAVAWLEAELLADRARLHPGHHGWLGETGGISAGIPGLGRGQGDAGGWFVPHEGCGRGPSPVC